MIDGFIILLLCLVLLVLVGLYGRFAQGPESVRQLAREEIVKTKSEDRSEAGKLFEGIKLFHDQLGDRLHDEIRASEARARAAERATADAATALDAATTLVRELRATLERLRGESPIEIPQPHAEPPPHPEPPDDSDSRQTINVPAPKPPVAEDEEDEPEELTQVAQRPIAGTTAAPNGLRLTPRAATPPPSTAPSTGGRKR